MKLFFSFFPLVHPQVHVMSRHAALGLHGFGSWGAAGVTSVSWGKMTHVRYEQDPASAKRDLPLPELSHEWACLWKSRFKKGKNCCTTSSGKQEWEMWENSPQDEGGLEGLQVQSSIFMQPRRGPQRSWPFPAAAGRPPHADSGEPAVQQRVRPEGGAAHGEPLRSPSGGAAALESGLRRGRRTGGAASRAEPWPSFSPRSPPLHPCWRVVREAFWCLAAFRVKTQCIQKQILPDLPHNMLKTDPVSETMEHCIQYNTRDLNSKVRFCKLSFWKYKYS